MELALQELVLLKIILEVSLAAHAHSDKLWHCTLANYSGISGMSFS